MALGKSAQEDIAQLRKTADRLNAAVVTLNEQMLQRCGARVDGVADRSPEGHAGGDRAGGVRGDEPAAGAGAERPGARQRGAQGVTDLPAYIDAYVARRVSEHRGERQKGSTAQQVAKEVRGPIEQLLRLVVPGFKGTGRRHRHQPFGEVVPGFFEYLVAERGLRPDSVRHYVHHLQRLEAYLVRVGVRDVQELSPALLSAFVAERSATGLAKTSVRDGCGVLRVFLRYAHREGLVGTDLSRTVEWPQVYRLSSIPRSISWTEVEESWRASTGEPRLANEIMQSCCCS